MAGSVKRRTFLYEQAHVMHFYNHLTEITT